MAKKLLTISIVALVVGFAFVAGIINAQNAVGLYVVLPLGAVFFGLFMIFRSLEKEVALYDREQQAHSAIQKSTTAEACDCSTHARGKTAAAH